MSTFSCGVDDLVQVCTAIVEKLGSEGVIILQGDLASGKTTLTQAFAKFLKIEDAVTSPTFSLQQCYGDGLFHYDIYNNGTDNFLALGMLEELEKPGYHLIEWGDDTLINILKTAQIPTVVVVIEKEGPMKRTYRITDA